MDSIPRDIGKTWIDPVPSGGSGSLLARDFLGNSMPQEIAPWKRDSFGRHKVSYGKKTNLPILEQWQGLPIYNLKRELVEALRKSQLLVVIGETSSGKTTQINQYLAEEGFCVSWKIVCTQPCHVAAMSVAKRVS